MDLKFLKYYISFFILVLLQIVICNNINFSGYINPFVYISFILILPITTKNSHLLIIAFLLGCIIDIFSNTWGLHTFATVFVAFVRPYVLRSVTPRGGYNTILPLSMRIYGASWFLLYASIVVVIHHFVYFYLEVLSFAHFFNTLLRVGFSFIFTMLFVTLFELFYSQTINDRKR